MDVTITTVSGINRFSLRSCNTYMDYVKDLFQNHSLFHKALKEAFEIFCNKRVAGVSIAEILDMFCHNILKKGGGSQKLSDEAIEKKFENVVTLLSYISEKDVFNDSYWYTSLIAFINMVVCRKKLARRYLFGLSGNDAHERMLITMFKEVLGGQFTSKMELMVRDMELARENKKEFKEYCSTTSGLDLTVNVLTTGIWPSYEISAINLPREMVKSVEMFQSFYATKHNHRKLSWIYSLGTCEVVGNFEQNSVELVVSTSQAALLCLFNETERLSFKEIMEQLGIGHEDLCRLLRSLSCGKYSILIKEPESTTIFTSDIFTFNNKFSHKKKRVKVPLPLDKEKKVEVVKERDRKYEIEAAIVRLMKSRKVMTLVSECVEQLKLSFKPDIKKIKQVIERLMEREYIERDRENPSSYKYMP